MEHILISDPLFREAVEAIDNGNLPVLEKLINEHPRLVRERSAEPKEGYFKEPYLIWFVADNPIRNPALAPNIVEITDILIRAIQREAAETKQFQFDYTLGLVVTGRIPRESGKQLQLMDLLIDAGAQPGGGMGAVAHGNLDAAEHLIRRGGPLSLGVAICLERMDDIVHLLPNANNDEKLAALTAAAFYGKTAAVAMLIPLVTDINEYPSPKLGFHSHATPLHQAVWSGSLNTIKELVNAGARLNVKDKVYDGTPIGWAAHMIMEETDEKRKEKISLIIDYLRQRV